MFAQWQQFKKTTLCPTEVIPSQGDESSALSIRKFSARVAGNRRNTRNNRSFPDWLNAPVWLYQPCAHSFSLNQKSGKRRSEGKKTEGLTRATVSAPDPDVNVYSTLGMGISNFASL